MSTFILPKGRFVELDIIQFAIRWCQVTISSKYKNFAFVHANVRNEAYNRSGAIQARSFCFPFMSESFDFCLATSLFTHLVPTDTEQYVAEVGRTLLSNGRFLSTWFLLDETTLPYIEAGKSEYTFPFTFASHAQHLLHAPERAVAYGISYLQSLFARTGFEIEAVYHGGWSGVPDSMDSGQDVILARRCLR